MFKNKKTLEVNKQVFKGFLTVFGRGGCFPVYLKINSKKPQTQERWETVVCGAINGATFKAGNQN